MDKFAIIGLGRFGGRLAKLLAANGAEVIAIDSNREATEALRDDVSLAVTLDCTDKHAIRSQGIDKVDVAIVGIGEAFESSVMITALLSELDIPRIISRAGTKIRGDILTKVGAHDIVNPERESAHRWCNELLAPAIITQFELGEGYSFAQVGAPERFYGKTLEDLRLRQKYNVNVVAIRRRPKPTEAEQPDPKKKQEPIISLPMGDTVIQPGDMLMLVGNEEAMRSFPTD